MSPSTDRVAGRTTMSALLEVDGLVKHFAGRGGATVHAVDGIDFEIARGETHEDAGLADIGRFALNRMKDLVDG